MHIELLFSKRRVMCSMSFLPHRTAVPVSSDVGRFPYAGGYPQEEALNRMKAFRPPTLQKAYRALLSFKQIDIVQVWDGMVR